MELAELRRRANLTQIELAQALGVTDHTVRNWEKGRTTPNLNIPSIKFLCQLLKCSEDELAEAFTRPKNNPAIGATIAGASIGR